MEIFVSWKTMNNQTSRFLSCFACAVALSAGSVAQVYAAPRSARGSGPESSPRSYLDASAEAQASSAADRIAVTLSDPSRPALVKASMVNGGITVKAYEGKEVVVEARSRSHEGAKSEGGPKRLAISVTGLTVEEENNEVRINTESYARTIDLTISVPATVSPVTEMARRFGPPSDFAPSWLRE